jgi:hypothetical protein
VEWDIGLLTDRASEGRTATGEPRPIQGIKGLSPGTRLILTSFHDWPTRPLKDKEMGIGFEDLKREEGGSGEGEEKVKKP